MYNQFYGNNRQNAYQYDTSAFGTPAQRSAAVQQRGYAQPQYNNTRAQGNGYPNSAQVSQNYNQGYNQPPLSPQNFQGQPRQVPAQPQSRFTRPAFLTAPGNSQGGNGRRHAPGTYSAYLYRKFSEFDRNCPQEGERVKEQLRSQYLIGILEFNGVIFLKFPYDPSCGFSDYLKQRYHVTFYKAWKIWACEPEKADAVWADMCAAADREHGGLRLPDGSGYVFPKPQRRNWRQQ